MCIIRYNLNELPKGASPMCFASSSQKIQPVGKEWYLPTYPLMVFPFKFYYLYYVVYFFNCISLFDSKTFIVLIFCYCITSNDLLKYSCPGFFFARSLYVYNIISYLLDIMLAIFQRSNIDTTP